MQVQRLSATQVQVEVPVKINLTLQILGKRPDGYHELETVMAEVPWGERLFLEITPNQKGISFWCDKADLNTSENLVVRSAAAYLKRAAWDTGCSIRLEKRAPVGAGLGGGSADAAAVALALNTLCPTPLPLPVMEELQAALGSDTAFFLTGGLCLCRGRGEQVTPLGTTLPFPLYLILPSVFIPTREVYKNLKLPLPLAVGTVENPPRRFSSPAEVGRILVNHLEEPVFLMHPGLREIKKKLLARKDLLGAQLSGSGSALFALASPDADDCSVEIEKQTGCRTIFVRPQKT